MTVGVARQVEHLPAADRLSRLERLGILRVVDEGRQLLLLRADGGRLLGRRPVLEQVLLRALGGLGRPRSPAVLVVEHSLVHGRLREAGDDRGAADVVGMEVRDDDPLGPAHLLEDALPALFVPGQAEARVDDDRAAVVGRQHVRVDVVDSERQRERDADDPVVERHHHRRGLAAPS